MIELKHVSKSYTNHQDAVSDINLTVNDGEFLVFLGPSGCGKSTILRMIAGLEAITAGTLHIDGQDHTATPASEHGVAMVFQNYALYPHLTVRDNIGFGMLVRRVKKATMHQKAEKIAAMLDLTEQLDKFPGNLSGGQMQRVALGRAIASDAQIHLMDEPLSNLDARLRDAMRKEIILLHQRLKTTTVYVTHDQIEAMTMADRIVVIDQGRIQQIGTPQELYAKPANTFVARFFGLPPMNLLRLPYTDAGYQLAGHTAPPTVSAQDDYLYLGLRPEAIRLADTGMGATVELIEALGGTQRVHVTVADQPVIVQTDGTQTYHPGQTVHLAFAPTACTYFAQSGQRLDLA